MRTNDRQFLISSLSLSKEQDKNLNFITRFVVESLSQTSPFAIKGILFDQHSFAKWKRKSSYTSVIKNRCFSN